MNLLPASSIPINSLVNALITFEESGASYYVSSIGFSLSTHQVMVDLVDPETLHFHSSLPFSGLEQCSFQLNSNPPLGLA